MVSEQIENLIILLSKLPGLGPRSARRAVLELLKRRDTFGISLIAALKDALDNSKICSSCGNLDTLDPCQLCEDPKRDASLICVVEDIADLWALERARVFNGSYHVLGGVLSALDGVGPDELNISSLMQRVIEENVKEVILATSATVDGQTTAHYLIDRFTGMDVELTELAHGVPVGGELDYLDDGTLGAALKDRRQV
ncbi:MAG: recombination mediator RecR [Pseudomonadota bacterium]|nr:recombination mediator RecR [Pseudomonadota bacterium]